jgi:hypothetical protein
MKKIAFLISLFLLISTTSISVLAQYNLQEAKNCYIKVRDTPREIPNSNIKVIRGRPLKYNEGSSEDSLVINNSINSSTHDLRIIKEKYAIKEKYWWKKDANFYDFKADIDSLLKYYNGDIDTTGESKKTTDFLLEKYRNNKSLAVFLSTKVKPKNDTVQKRFNQYKKLMRAVFNDSTNTLAELEILRLKFEAEKLKLDKDYDDLEKVINEFNEKEKSSKGKLDTIGKDEKGQGNAFAAIPSFVSAIGQITPSITLLGQSNFNNSRFFADVRVFTGSSEIKSKMENLFIPEASKWGISIGALYRFSFTGNTNNLNPKASNDNRNWGIHFGLNYLGKDLSRTMKNLKDTSKIDTVRFDPGIFHFKLGLQHIIIPDFLSLYANYNVVWITQNYKAVKDAFKENNGLISFWDGGIKCYLALPKQKNLALVLDLGFVFTNTSIKSYTASDDRVIPNIKISLRSNFGI